MNIQVEGSPTLKENVTHEHAISFQYEGEFDSHIRSECVRLTSIELLALKIGCQWSSTVRIVLQGDPL